MSSAGKYSFKKHHNMILDDIDWRYLTGIISIDILIMVIMEFFRNIQKHILMIVLAFCISCILTIGLKLCFVPCPKWAEEYADGINNILLNLSYSYVAGYIIYWFTVIIPEERDRKEVLPLLRNEVISLWTPIQNVFNWYIAFNVTEYVKATQKEVSNAIKTGYRKDYIYDPTQNIDYINLLKIRLDEFRKKASLLFKKNRYFNAEQYKCLIVIINEDYNPFSNFAVFKGESPKDEDAIKRIVSDQLWKVIEEYIKLRESFGIEDDLFLNSIFKSPNGSLTVKRVTANNSQNNK